MRTMSKDKKEKKIAKKKKKPRRDEKKKRGRREGNHEAARPPRVCGVDVDTRSVVEREVYYVYIYVCKRNES